MQGSKNSIIHLQISDQVLPDRLAFILHIYSVLHLRCLLAALTAHAAKTQPSLKAACKTITLLLPLSCVDFVSEIVCKVLCSSHCGNVLLQLNACRPSNKACLRLLLSLWIDVLQSACFQALVQDRVKPKDCSSFVANFIRAASRKRHAVDELRLIWSNCAAPMMHQFARSPRPPSRPGTISSGTEMNELKQDNDVWSS